MTLITKLPNSCEGDWINCTNAQIDDTNYAETTTNAISCIWKNFGFPLLHHLINTIKVKVKTYTGDSKHSISLKVWNGSEFGQSHYITPVSICLEEIIDVTDDFSWTGEMIEQIKIQLTSDIGGGPSSKKWVRCCFIEIEVNYTIGQVYIATLANPKENNTISFSILGYSFLGWSYMNIGASTGWIYRGYIEWDISSIPDSVSIKKVVLKYHGYEHNIDCHIHGMLSFQPSSRSPTQTDYQKIFGEINEGKIYANLIGFPEVGIEKEIDLGSNGILDLKNQLSSDWFAIGFQSNNEEALKVSRIYLKEYVDAKPKPTLYIEYSFDPPTLSSGKIFIIDKENNLFRVEPSDLSEEEKLDVS